MLRGLQGRPARRLVRERRPQSESEDGWCESESESESEDRPGRMLQELPRQPAQQLVWQRRTQEWGFQELQQQQKQLVWQLRLQERLLLALGATLSPGFEGQPRPGHAK